MDAVDTSASTASLVLVVDVEPRRMRVVVAAAVAVPWLRIVKLTVTLDPAAPDEGDTDTDPGTSLDVLELALLGSPPEETRGER